MHTKLSISIVIEVFNATVINKRKIDCFLTQDRNCLLMWTALT